MKLRSRLIAASALVSLTLTTALPALGTTQPNRASETASQLVKDTLGYLSTHLSGTLTTSSGVENFDGRGALAVTVTDPSPSSVGHQIEIVSGIIYAKYTLADLQTVNYKLPTPLTAAQLKADANQWLKVGPLMLFQSLSNDPTNLFKALQKGHVAFARGTQKNIAGHVVIPVTLKSSTETDIWYVPVTGAAAPGEVITNNNPVQVTYENLPAINAPTKSIDMPGLNNAWFYNGPWNPTMVNIFVAPLVS